MKRKLFGAMRFRQAELSFQKSHNMKLRAFLGFTLIELLVVIAIIVLLVSILVPSLKQAKELARRAVCATKLRSINTAANIYSTENMGYCLPMNAPIPGYSGAGLNWARALIYLGYVGGQKGNGVETDSFFEPQMFSQFSCPSVEIDEDSYDKKRYGYYAMMRGVGRYTSTEKAYYFNEKGQKIESEYLHCTEVPNPSNVFMLTDRIESASYAQHCIQIPCPDNDRNLTMHLDGGNHFFFDGSYTWAKTAWLSPSGYDIDGNPTWGRAPFYISAKNVDFNWREE